MKVLVCDDEEGLGRAIVEAIAEGAPGNLEVSMLVGNGLTEELTRLFQRVQNCLDEPESYRSRNDLAFDEVDLAILDNNLAHLDIKGARLTAESIAGYVRAFTGVPYLVSLNKNPDVDFDLRYLVGDYETRADIALNTHHLENKALWTRNRADSGDGFLPWYWPELRAAPERRRGQIAFMRGRLSDPVFATLALPTNDEALGFLSLHAKGALSPDAQAEGSEEAREGTSIGDLSFRDFFVSRSRSLPTKDEREQLFAAATAGNEAIDLVIRRVVAADLDFWFRRDVVGPQELLVDVPHLLMRMPFLLGEGAADVNAWNRAINELAPPFGLDPALFTTRLEKATFEHDIWITTPAFQWPSLKKDEKLNDLFFSSKQDSWADVVFCEDRSEFCERSPKDGDGAPAEFSSELEGNWGRRHVARVEGYRYKPQSRFAV
jgi:hypothetical protein